MKSVTKLKVESLLKRTGLRRTEPRVAILAALLGARVPQTANQLAVKLAEAGPNRVTIYRVLENFVEAGLVHKAFLRKRTWHFEPAHNCTKQQCHPHFTCTNCDETSCLTEISMPMAKSPYKGFVIGRQRVQFEGLCPDCSGKN